jgi:putative membrane protein
VKLGAHAQVAEAAMKTTALLGVFLMLSGSALAQSLGEKTGVNSVLGITPSTADFVKEAAIADMFEVESSKLATQKAEGPAKNFATQMVEDHTKTSQELKSDAEKANISLPNALDSSTQKKLDSLQHLDGQEFTKQYVKDQVSAHKDAVSLFERYGKNGDNNTLKAWATETLPTLQHHLDMAQNLEK